MKNGKLKLESLKVKSFTTNLSNTETKDIKGGLLNRGNVNFTRAKDVKHLFTVGVVRLRNPVTLKGN